MAKLDAKNECLKRWSAFFGWSQGANDQLAHVIYQLESQKLGAQELAHLLAEAEEVIYEEIVYILPVYLKCIFKTKIRFNTSLKSNWPRMPTWINSQHLVVRQ